MSGFGDDGTIDDLPWASVFDPAGNARALSAVQAQGFRAASRIVDRFARAVTVGGDATGSGAAETAAAAGAPELERLTRAWWSTAGRLLLGSASGDAVRFDVSRPDSTGGLTRQVVLTGCGGTEVWLHNTGPEDRAEVRLRCSDLLSHDGAVIGADAVHLDPAVVPMPGLSSRGVCITVDVAPEAEPGVYRGTLLAGGQPGLWLPVVLTVRPRNA